MKANPGLFHFLKLFYTKQLVASGFVSKSSLTELPFSGFFSPFIPKQFSSFLFFQNSLQNRQVETFTTAEVTTEHCGCVQRREQPAQRDSSTASPPPPRRPPLIVRHFRPPPPARGLFLRNDFLFLFFFFFHAVGFPAPPSPPAEHAALGLFPFFVFSFFSVYNTLFKISPPPLPAPQTIASGSP